jgi:hypothetical protein
VTKVCSWPFAAVELISQKYAEQSFELAAGKNSPPFIYQS